MSELRRDVVAGRWVIVNTEDSAGPGDYEKETHHYHQEATCQFCPGREAQTPSEVQSIRAPHSNAWSVRVVPNKFPVLRIEGDIDRRGIGIFDVSNGIGAHEVLIETPEHRAELVDLPLDAVKNVIRMYVSRLSSLAGDKRFKYVLIFKNFGESAGASIEHAHSQIIALPMVPKYILEELHGVNQYYGYRGRCVFCDMIQQERDDTERIVTENDDFLAFCPYAPRYPFESWIIPKQHRWRFDELSDGEQHNLARILKEMLQRNKVCLSDPSFNYYLRTAPVNSGNQEGFHWHIEVIPQLTRVVGFEWATGLYVVPTAPAMAARHLREVSV